MKKTLSNAISSLAIVALAASAMSASAPALAKKKKKEPVQLNQCESSMGTIAVLEGDTQGWTEYDLGSPRALVNSLAAESGCFTPHDPTSGTPADFLMNVVAGSSEEVDQSIESAKGLAMDCLGRSGAAGSGLGSVPGGGGEILVDRVRKEITRGKVLTDDWLNVMRVWHQLGGKSTATMMFGHVETLAERIEHFERGRELQDETGGFTAFISWTCQPDGTPEEHLYPEKATPAVYLRVQALSRIFLDNVESIQTSYVTQGMKMGQMSLRYGANDFGGTMIEENVVSAAGCFHLESVQRVEHLIQWAGFTPRQRNSWYGIVDERVAAPAHPADRLEAATHPAATDGCAVRAAGAGAGA